ncbi:MAG: 7-carboxy-7-deazaguanine synthase [Phycisphaerae bacterium]|nr:7-carboxy-7-deazaguanine synthase [Gemmatimonadaceae bacterium]
MAYTVKECFYTLQGEGSHAGRPAVFLRFSGCNLWSGREADRASAVCTFCDTDFVGIGPDGGRFATGKQLAAFVRRHWPGHSSPRTVPPFVVCTGGEPLLQLDGEAISALHAEGFEIAVETNGTQPAPEGLDWICVSPKAGAELSLTSGNELKLVFPQALARPERFAGLNFEHFLLQPMDGPDAAANTQAALMYCLANPQWRLSLQTHKLLNIR